MSKRLLITGGAGFIGGHLVRHIFRAHPDYKVRVLDALTYAGSRENLAEFEGDPRFEFVHANILDIDRHRDAFDGMTDVIHLAAETHNDRAILECGGFVIADVLGTQRMLQAALEAKVERFVHVSTCEVYGSIEKGQFKEEDAFHPNQPYSASKAGGDLIARAYHRTHGLPILIVRPVNNLGPNQFPEKLIPLMISRALADEPLPIYGDGKQIREWIYVEDCCAAIDTVLHKGIPGEAYNIGDEIERDNLTVVQTLLAMLGKPEGKIEFVKDRPGHDHRYALDVTKVRSLGWKAKVGFEEALQRTVDWYLANREWLETIQSRSAQHREFLKKWYDDRMAQTS